MKLLLCCLLSVSGFAQSHADSSYVPSRWLEDLVPSFSLDYHYQKFHGMEAAMHLTHYNLAAKVHHEYGLFFGTDINFNNGFYGYHRPSGRKRISCLPGWAVWDFPPNCMEQFITTTGMPTSSLPRK